MRELVVSVLFLFALYHTRSVIILPQDQTFATELSLVKMRLFSDLGLTVFA